MRYNFTIKLAPVGKGRPRQGRFGMYTPKKTKEWETKAAIFARASVLEKLAGPVRVDILAVLPRPKKYNRKKDHTGLLWAVVRPDLDNIRKIVLDAMKDCWKDDSQVVAGGSLKVYAEVGGEPRVEVWVTDEFPGVAQSAMHLRHGLITSPGSKVA